MCRQFETVPFEPSRRRVTRLFILLAERSRHRAGNDVTIPGIFQALLCSRKPRNHHGNLFLQTRLWDVTECQRHKALCVWSRCISDWRKRHRASGSGMRRPWRHDMDGAADLFRQPFIVGFQREAPNNGVDFGKLADNTKDRGLCSNGRRRKTAGERSRYDQLRKYIGDLK